jgi:predicted dehydrogenase
MGKLRIGIVGYGYWGPNLVRNFSSSPLSEVAAVCDANPARLDAVRQVHGSCPCVESLDQLLQIPLDAVAIATPVSTHAPIAQRCLEAGLHVLMEKPLAANTAEAEQLVALAGRQQRVLMVDHTYLFSNPVRQIKALVESGELGELYYVDSVRINLGLFQKDVNVLWDLAPHDLAIVDHVLGLDARSISAWGCGHVHAEMEDVAYLNVDYGDAMLANFHVNWLSPVKVRQMIFAGSRRSVIFNDLNPTEPVKVYDRGIELGTDAPERHRLLVGYRTGDVWSPHIEPNEPLQAVVRHFAECIRDGAVPLSDGAAGLRVVRLLEAATRSIRAQGGRVVLSNGGVGNARANARTVRSAEFPAHRTGRPNGSPRGGTRVRQPVRL